MRNIVVTGFGPFGPYPRNITEDALVGIEEGITERLESKIHGFVFPADIPSTDRGEQLLLFAKTVKADAIISLGMSSSLKGFAYEMRATNLVKHARYVSNDQNGLAVSRKYPMDSVLRMNLKPWNLAHFHFSGEREDVSVYTSTDAGNFCCNHLMFQVLAIQQHNPEHASVPFIFLHVPCSWESVRDAKEHAALGKIFVTVADVQCLIRDLIVRLNPTESARF